MVAPDSKVKRVRAVLTLLLLAACPMMGRAGSDVRPASGASDADSLADALQAGQWVCVEGAVDRALNWLARQQQSNGSYSAPSVGQPAITALCVMAYLSRGHQPGFGPYGQSLEHAIDFVLACQRSDGLLCQDQPQRHHVHLGASHTATYNHAIAGLMLGEVYGASENREREDRIKRAIQRALVFSRHTQLVPRKGAPEDNGGWRYLHQYGHPTTSSTSDLSVTGWQLMFLRSARNAEFDVPAEYVASAMDYVSRCYDPRLGVFHYGLRPGDRYYSRAMVGAGILALSLGGQHQTEMAQRAGDWIVQHPFSRYGETVGGRGDRFHYAAYYCSQAMAQLGGDHWAQFYPVLVETLLRHQSGEGWWPPERQDASFGRTYTTALSVLALTPPYQLLPIYQR